jgi:CRISPR-associated protein Csd1
MILQDLVACYDMLAEDETVQIPKMGYSFSPVDWCLVVNDQGDLVGMYTCESTTGVTPSKDQPKSESKSKAKKQKTLRKTMLVPILPPRTRNVDAGVLYDNLEYMLGYNSLGYTGTTVEKYVNFRDKNTEFLKDIDTPAAKAVVNFYANWSPQNISNHSIISELGQVQKIDGKQMAVFVYEGTGEYVLQDEEIKAKCDSTCAKRYAKDFIKQTDETQSAISLVSGDKVDATCYKHTQIKGLHNSQPSGASLVSFNADSFCSYGLEQSYNAPVGVIDMYKYTTALNYLIKAGSGYNRRIDDTTTIVYWSADKSVNDIDSDLFNTDSAKLTEVLHLLQGNTTTITDKHLQVDLSAPYFIAFFKLNHGARIYVERYITTNVGNLLQGSYNHYKRLEMFRASYESASGVAPYHILQQTLREADRKGETYSGKFEGSILSDLYMSIVTDTPYPQALADSIMNRISKSMQDDYQINYTNMSFLKAYLIKNKNLQGGEKYMALNEESENTMYNIGRLIAVCDYAQTIYSNDKRTRPIRKKYLVGVTEHPSSLLPQLLAKHNVYVTALLAKDTEKKHTGTFLDRCTADILAKIDNVPATTKQEDQMMCYLGYYHQLKKFYTKKTDKDTVDKDTIDVNTDMQSNTETTEGDD